MKNIHTSNPTPGQAEDAALQLQDDFIDILGQELGMHEREATPMAHALVRGLRKRYGGRRLGAKDLYIPAPSKQERDDAIRREFDGTNADEVMQRHGIKRSRLYQIVGAPRPGGRPSIGVSSPAAPLLAINSPVCSRESGQNPAYGGEASARLLTSEE
jgi:Mor family transcriptional regulator